MISRQNNAEVGRHAKGPMDRSRSPVNSQRREAASRRPHKPEVVGSNPTAATSVLPDRCGYVHQPVEGRPEFREASDTANQVPGQPGF